MTIVLLPGLGGSSTADFAFLAPMLSRRHVVTPVDLPLDTGFDRSVERVRGGLPAGDLTLVGYSIGAAVALALAASTPTVTRLVLVSPPFVCGERQRRFAATWAALPPAARRDFERFAALEGDEAGELASFEASLVASLPGVDLRDAAAEVTAPTLILGGSSDAILGREQAPALLGAIEPARLAVLEGGHALVDERPAHVLALVDAFLSEPERHPAGSILPTGAP